LTREGTRMSVYLNMNDVLRRIEQALSEGSPLSLVRIGDGENIVMAQKSVWTLRKVLSERWAIKANKGEKGVTLPNLSLRNELVSSIRAASIVGLLPDNDEMIKAPSYLKRPLTDRIFKHFKLKPALTCHACINRMMPGNEQFWQIVRNHRVLLVTRYPAPLKDVLENDPFQLRVTHTIAFNHYDQIQDTLDEINELRSEFDIALLSCGVNAVVLAPQIAELTGKVAIDFGKGPEQLKAVAKRLNKPSSKQLSHRELFARRE